MRKILFLPILILFLALFFTVGNQNQVYAIGEGEACQSRSGGVDIPNGGCDAGLTCDTRYVENYPNNCSGSADHGSCTGICRKNCGVYPGGPANGGCAATDACYLSGYTSGYGGSGYCIPDTIPHIPTGSTCTREENTCQSTTCAEATETPEKQRGNCADPNDICDLQLNGPCSGGRCQGRCLPKSNSYTCNPSLESRQNVEEFSCPLGYTCAEVAGRSQARDVDIDGGCVMRNVNNSGWIDLGQREDCETDIITCPDCQFACRATDQVRATCSCTNQGSPVSGQNKIVCKNSQKSEEVFCKSVGVACYETSRNTPIDPYSIKEEDYNKLVDAFPGQSLTGVMCRTPDEYQQQQSQLSPPIPPAPPCVDGIDQGDGKCLSIVTAFGEVGTNPGAFITRFFSIVLGAAGTIALILFMRAGYQIMSARGNPEGIKEGREKLVAAILGLMFIIFSFVLLEVIGVDLLRLPNASSENTLIPEFGTCDVNNPKCEPGLVCNYNGAQGQCQRP